MQEAGVERMDKFCPVKAGSKPKRKMAFQTSFIGISLRVRVTLFFLFGIFI
jgi:hypothetical protein